MVKNPSVNTRDVGLIPGLRRFPGEGNGSPLQYSCLGDLMDRGPWGAAVRGHKESDTAERLSAQEGNALRETKPWSEQLPLPGRLCAAWGPV